MAVLQEVRSGRQQILLARVVAGRGILCLPRLNNRFCSQEHAVLRFEQGAWWVQDLTSRNGTWVDGERLTPGQAVPIGEGAVLAFGSPGEAWTLVEASPPSVVAEDLVDGVLRTCRGEVLLLPSEEAPEVAIYPDGSGGWVADVDGVIRPIRHDERITVGDRPWRLYLPHGPAPTWQTHEAVLIPSRKLVFRVSADEEYVELTVIDGERCVALRPRIHTALLLTLARRRLAEADIPPAERGWLYVDDLCRMMRMDRRTLNVHTFRARLQLAEAGLDGVLDLLNRRVSTDQIRLGVVDVTIEPVQ